MKKRLDNEIEMTDGEQTQSDLGKIRFRLLLSYFVLIVIAVLAVSAVTISTTYGVMRNKTSSLLSALNMQIRMNISSYFDGLESASVLVFADEENYQYDPAQETDEAVLNRKLDEISDHLVESSLMRNYSDFGIVYRSGVYAGRISDGTMKLFGDQLFDQMEQCVDDEKRQDGWTTGYNGNFSRLYYVKRLNQDALLVFSVYSMELAETFEYSEDTQQVTVRVVDEDGNVIYSSLETENGQKLAEDILQSVGDYSAASIVDEKYMHHISTCGKWRVICTISMEDLDKEYQMVRMRTALAAILTTIVGVILGLFISRIITNPLNNMVYGLSERAEYDLLTGIFNKMTFELYAEEMFDDPELDGDIAYFLSDVDDFKKVNDICGHSAGDRVLKQYGKIIGDIFHKDVPGRIGGDEFAAVIHIPKTENPYIYMGERIKNIQKRVAQIHEENAEIHVSIGVAFRGKEKLNMKDLYRNADQALYETKRRGKNGYTIYDQGKMGREGEQT